MLYLEQNKTVASRFAQTSAKEREKTLNKIKFNSNITLKVIKGTAKIFKNYSKVKKCQNENFEEFDCVKLDEM